MKNVVSLFALLALGLGAVGCSSPGEAFVKDVCACTDSECAKKAFDSHGDKFPAAKAKLGEMDKLPDQDKKHVAEAMACMMKIASEKK